MSSLDIDLDSESRRFNLLWLCGSETMFRMSWSEEDDLLKQNNSAPCVLD